MSPPVATERTVVQDDSAPFASKQLSKDFPGAVPPGCLDQPTPALPTESLLVNLDLDAFMAQNSDYSKDFEKMDKARRAANYIAAAMIFLKDNVEMKEQLSPDHIKNRLLGHWGTCPTITFIYSHCNLLIRKHDLDMFLVLGPGHGAPGLLANLYLEGTLAKFDDKYNWSVDGLYNLIKGFSWPGGFPSHVNAETPGAIHEGGELGYALAVSFGAIMDNPDTIVTCIVGDGEAETGPTATAWHSYKYIDPKRDGAVIPILNCNGYKIAETTVFGTMSDIELVTLFSGYGYQARVVDKMDKFDIDMAASMEWAYKEIRKIQKAARDGKPLVKPRWPMIILRSPKGWTGPREVHGKQIEGTWRSHQVPLPAVKKDKEELDALQKWLLSYKPDELFKNGTPIQDVIDAFPHSDRMMGRNKKTYAAYKPLSLPDYRTFMFEHSSATKDDWQSCTKTGGQYLKAVVEANRQTFRIFSPDELSSNKLDAVLEKTDRSFQWDPFTRGGGQVLEVLSEHQCQGWMQGYTLTGRVGLFPSYESFLPIVTTMIIQYAKFQKMASETRWRREVGSLNYIESSTLWRQEHNGYSHQNPSLIDTLINLKSKLIRIYLPPDANCLVSTLNHCLTSKNYINLIVSSKQPMPVFLSREDAIRHCAAGASVWKQFSSDEGCSPDVVLVGCGNEVTFEVVAAARMLQKDLPNIKVRVVNVTDLMILSATGGHPHSLSDEEFQALFTKAAPIIVNFHGYPSVIHALLFDRPTVGDRLTVNGYREEGTTTTPFKMLTANGCDRFHLAIDALRAVIRHGREEVYNDAHLLMSEYRMRLRAHDKYILEHGDDPKEMMEIPSL
ncbi:hypothetical protein HDU85_005767 [Gaertneriomyces sp. JEL0708]|nr:hypothetical protein HDU85_005767 [Gaertneriomyces sp. JEL0708]